MTPQYKIFSKAQAQECKTHTEELYQERQRQLTIDRIIKAFRENKFEHRFHDNDLTHYQKRLREYDSIQARLDQLDPIKDYTERNILMNKRRIIREDFALLKTSLQNNATDATE